MLKCVCIRARCRCCCLGLSRWSTRFVELSPLIGRESACAMHITLNHISFCRLFCILNFLSFLLFVVLISVRSLPLILSSNRTYVAHSCTVYNQLFYEVLLVPCKSFVLSNGTINNESIDNTQRFAMPLNGNMQR